MHFEPNTGHAKCERMLKDVATRSAEFYLDVYRHRVQALCRRSVFSILGTTLPVAMLLVFLGRWDISVVVALVGGGVIAWILYLHTQVKKVPEIEADVCLKPPTEEEDGTKGRMYH